VEMLLCIAANEEHFNHPANSHRVYPSKIMRNVHILFKPQPHKLKVSFATLQRLCRWTCWSTLFHSANKQDRKM